MMITVWFLASFLNAAQPFVIDPFPYTTQVGCQRAAMMWAGTAKALEVRCAQTTMKKSDFDKIIADMSQHT